VWLYEIISGKMYDMALDGAYLAGTAWSGYDVHRNNPASCIVHHLGPIPPGVYQIEPARDSTELGPLVLDLTHVVGDNFGRSLFRIHGDNRTPQLWDASHGCIIAEHALRVTLSESTDRTLLVVAELPHDLAVA